MDLPGGDDFYDVTQVFKDAAEDMTIDELIMARGFTLNEAMSAVEIGDPRMDSGAAQLENGNAQKFDPCLPLLPEEICFILDRALACEMHWHAGNALAQTVLTCRYVHHIKALTEMHKASLSQDDSIQKPLISQVLRGGIVGLLKCCDLAYRELVKGNVHDCEDWQGEKSNVSLLESWPNAEIHQILGEAVSWLESHDQDIPFREDLLIRLQLRITLLRLLSLELPQNAPFIGPLLTEARRLFIRIRSQKICISPGSIARSAFDPHITRELHSVMPLRPLEIPDQEESWMIFENMLDSWERLHELSKCESLLGWVAVSLTQASHAVNAPNRFPFMRSLAQTIFSNGSAIMERFNISWLTERFFLEIAHISFTHILSVFDERPSSNGNFETFHSTLCRLLLQHVWANYHNRPRQRRHLMKTALDWHCLYDTSIHLCNWVATNDNVAYVLTCIPPAILHWRALIIRDVILAGFELQLYQAEERVFAYWYLAKCLDSHAGVIRELMDVIFESTPAHQYLAAQLDYCLLLQDMSLGYFHLLTKPSGFDLVRRWTNFTVRYKWMLAKGYMDARIPDPFLPRFDLFLKEEREVLRSDTSVRYARAKELFENALGHAMNLGASAEEDSSRRLCRNLFLQQISGIMSTCDDVIQYLSDISGAYSTSRTTSGLQCKWHLDRCAWFPTFI